mgnify:CR=1 FL=1
MISIIAAIGERTRALGKDNDLLFKISEDLKRFKALTTGHPIIMGRKTWESLPRHPLPGRINIVVTKQEGYEAEGALVVSSVEEALSKAKESPGNEEVFVIGGGEIYNAALPQTSRLYLTLIDYDSEGDVYFPPYNEFSKTIEESEPKEENGLSYTYVTLER